MQPRRGYIRLFFSSWRTKSLNAKIAKKSREERKETMEPGGAAALMVLTLMAVARLSHASQQRRTCSIPVFPILL